MDKYKFGEFIYNQRKRLGLTQDELGRKLNVTNKAVSKWETGETLPDIQLLEKLANTLEVTIDELLTQQKSDKAVEKVFIKPKKYPYVIFSIVIVFVLFTTLIGGLNQNEKPVKEEITLENVDKYYLINPCEKSYIDGLELTIYGSIYEKEELIDSYIKINFSIQYYFKTIDDKLSEIIYIDRIIEYKGENNVFSITVKPKNQINNFQSFYGFNVQYEVMEVKGSLIENEDN